MAILITDECINCGACEPECPNTAIYSEGAQWRWADGTKLTEIFLKDGSTIDVHALQPPVSNDFFFIVSGKCTECTGFHEEPACNAVCPTSCCVPDPDISESKEDLLAKKFWLHGE